MMYMIHVQYCSYMINCNTIIDDCRMLTIFNYSHCAIVIIVKKEGKDGYYNGKSTPSVIFSAVSFPILSLHANGVDEVC